MSQIFSIQNDKVVITKLALTSVEGNVNQTGDLTVSGAITADTLHVKNIITEGNNTVEPGQWISNLEEDITGKGFSWTWGNGSYNLQYRDGGRLWSNADLDLDISKSYKIDNVSVIMAGALGPTITKSNLRQLGQLSNLTVLGDVELGQFATFDSSLGRLGINTPSPNGPLAIMENDVEFVAGSSRVGSANVGTYTNHDLNIITDNIPRITVKNTGGVTIDSDVTINGSLNVLTIVSDTRVDRTSPLEFKATRDTAIYGKGLIWSGTGPTRQMIMMANPDRIWSTESFDVAAGQSYYINGKAVLSENGLGETILNSNLSKLGNLESLSVIGTSSFIGDINAERSKVSVKSVVLNNGLNEVNISTTGIDTSSNLTINVSREEILYADANEIAIGDRKNQRKVVKINGPVSVGVNNPNPDIDLTVRGTISFSNRKFFTGTQLPTQGTYSKGDICWNENPQGDSYIGWVCIVDGTPGTWLPFGSIVRQ